MSRGSWWSTLCREEREGRSKADIGRSDGFLSRSWRIGGISVRAAVIVYPQGLSIIVLARSKKKEQSVREDSFVDVKKRRRGLTKNSFS